MIKARHHLAWALALLALGLRPDAATAQQFSPDSEALSILYESLGGPDWTNNDNWLTTAPIETWFGVEVIQDPDGAVRVTGIHLPENNLSGKLPESFGPEGLLSLSVLNLSFNDISGPVTGAVSTASLPSLRFLLLGGNQFDDTSGLSANESLTRLELGLNRLTFEDIEPLVPGRFEFLYAPQADVGTGGQFDVAVGASVAFSQPVLGQANFYQWYRDGAPLPDGTSDTFAIQSAAPDDAGTYRLEIRNSIATDLYLYSAPFIVTVAGQPEFAVSPGSLEFGDVRVGERTTQSVVVSNVGSGDLELPSLAVVGIAASDFAITAGGSPGTLVPGESRTVSVQFAPSAAGTRTARLVIESNAVGSPHRVALAGRGLEAELTVSPTTVDFQQVALGSTAQAMVELINTGGEPVFISGVAISGAGFSIVSGAQGGSLQPAQTHEIVLAFEPVGQGSHVGSLMVTSDAPGSPHVVDLAGAGVTGSLNVEPTAVTFDAVPVGGSADQTLTLRNTGQASLAIPSISVSGTGFTAVSGASPVTLEPGQEHLVVVRFEPPSRGGFSGAVTIGGQAATVVSLAGTGIGPALAAVPPSLDFGSIVAGTQAISSIMMTNTGEVGAAFVATLSGPQAGAFSVLPSSGAISAGSDFDLSVTFTPAVPGDHAAELAVSTGGSTPVLTILLQGTGTRIEIVGTPPGDVDARAGNDVGLSAELPPGFTPETAELCYRRTGEPTFVCVALVPSGSTYSGFVPAGFVSERGVDYYYRFTDGGATVTDPASRPEDDPYRLPVAVEALVTPVVLQPGVYRMLSTPVVLADPTAAGVLSGFGPPGPTSWRLLHWNASAQTYEEHPDPGLSFVPCRAHWIVTRSGGTIAVSSASTVDAVSPCDLVLQPGWNQMGNPYAFPIAWDSVSRSAPLDDPVRYDASVPREDPYRYNQTILAPWDGYWVFNPNTDPVSVTFEPVEAGGAVARSADRRVDFGVRLVASARGLVDSENYLGLASGASPGRDQLDFAEAPSIGEHVRLSIVTDGRRMAGDFRPAGPDDVVWDIEVSVGRADGTVEAGEPVRVELRESGHLPDGLDVRVLDRDLGRTVAVRDGAFVVVPSPEWPVRRFRIVIGAPDSDEHAGELPADATLEPPFPNPFRESVRITYMIGEPGRATLSVFDALGRRIRSLVDGQSPGGHFETIWDGRDDAGRPVPSGLYVLRLDGEATSTGRTLILVR